MGDKNVFFEHEGKTYLAIAVMEVTENLVKDFRKKLDEKNAATSAAEKPDENETQVGVPQIQVQAPAPQAPAAPAVPQVPQAQVQPAQAGAPAPTPVPAPQAQPQVQVPPVQPA